MPEEASTVAEGAKKPQKRPRNADPEQVARFPIKRRLGAGAMGVVLAGRDETLDREVAIKLVKPGRRGSDSAKQRLLREAQAMARVAHPNVVAIYEAGLHEDGVYIAMELVQGQPLDDWLKAEKRAVTAIVEQYIQAGRGLSAAHARGIIHRDFKPANVLVGDDGRTRVVDFGLARGTAVIDEEHQAIEDSPTEPSDASSGSDSGSGSGSGGSSSNILNAELTGRGAMLGTPAYMSLEHFRGRAVAASDQYSFGVALYRALYGKAPYTGDGLLGIYEAVLHEPVPTPPVLPEVPPRLASAVLRALAKEADDRWPSMDALVAELEAIIGVDPDHDPARSRRQRRLIAAVVSVFALASGLIAGFRSGWGATFTLKYVFVQSLLGLAIFAVMLFALRKSVLRDAYGRRLISLFLVIVMAMTVHRATAFFSDTSLLAVLRADAVFVGAIGAFASIVLERWLIVATALMAAFLVISFVAPIISVPAFGTSIVGIVAIAVWAWREPQER